MVERAMKKLLIVVAVALLSSACVVTYPDGKTYDCSWSAVNGGMVAVSCVEMRVLSIR